eukprot:6172127-Pleurochrysis_carterae.AAC.2
MRHLSEQPRMLRVDASDGAGALQSSVIFDAIRTFPNTHPKVTGRKNGAGDYCGTVPAQAPITAGGQWPYESGSFNKGGCQNMSGAEVFFGYNSSRSPYGADPGYFADGVSTVYLIVDDIDDMYLMITADSPNRQQNGSHSMDVTVTATGGTGSQRGASRSRLLRCRMCAFGVPKRKIMDDKYRDIGRWDPLAQSGFFSMTWYPCCIDVCCNTP